MNSRNRDVPAEDEKKQEDDLTPPFSAPSLTHALEHDDQSATTFSHSTRRARRRRSCWTTTARLARILLLDIPLLLVFALLVSSLALEKFAKEYLLKQVELLEWTPERAATELTYYHRVCDEKDQSAHDTSDLIVKEQQENDNKSSNSNAVDLMMRHGAAVFPHLLSEETATALRNFILQQNARNQDMIYVLENKNRWSFYLRVDQHPTVTAALRELLNNPTLVTALEQIAGRNPAIIEFTSITSAFGATAQHWHQDVVPDGNAAKYARTFIPSYSLFVPLQNTTAGMGATGVCPGTHMCAAGCGEFCVQTGFQLSGNNNNWPLGWGALLNQQTTHIGMPYSHPPDGPHRVVFILTFAPRPQWGQQQVETRTIGTGGSYSLHWSQWGHTLRDYQNPNKYMRQPWRSLRSLGIYKPSGADWGWDFFTQASGRVANGDVGYTWDELQYLLKEKKVFPFLPQSLLGELVGEGAMSDGESWVHFAFGTLSKCQAVIRRVYLGLLGLHISGLVGFAVVAKRQKRPLVPVISSTLVRVLLLHGTVLLVAWWSLTNAKNRNWARNIRAGRLLSLSSGPHATLPDIPASLPLLQDVLILDEMKSDYFATFTRVLDVVHPGNKDWDEMLEHSSPGYDTLSPPLQQQLRASLLRTTRQEQRRIMMKNSEEEWAEVDDRTAHWFCHKILLSKSNRYIREAVKHIDYFLSETKYGYWRETELHRRHIPEMLMKLQDAILRLSRRKSTKMLGKVGAGATTGSLQFLQITPHARVRNSTVPNRMARTNSLPPKPVISEPFPGAWKKEGDTVEATYAGMFQGRCTQSEEAS